MSEVIVVTSGKGGVGKTTTSANVGTGLAMLGEKVILIDTDIGLRNLDVVMGLENRIVYNLVDVVEGNCRLKQALIKDKRYPNQGEPLVGMNSFAGQAYLNICKRILGQEVPLMGLEKSKGFFHMFSGLLKRA